MSASYLPSPNSSYHRDYIDTCQYDL